MFGMPQITMLEKIQTCFHNHKVLYTRHARYEMRTEKFGRIYEEEISELAQIGKEIETYIDDTPHPSILVAGQTSNGRHLHFVCAYDGEEDQAIVVTAYEPDPNRWIDFTVRKKQ
jgi:hypothetical protein